MLKKITYAFLAVLVVAFTSCSQIDDLQSDLDELRKDYDELNADFDELKNSVDAIDAKLNDFITDVEEDIEDIQSEIAEDEIYWGDVSTDAQFQKVSDDGILQITGDVVVTSDSQLALLEKVVFVGGNLTIKNVTSFDLSKLAVVSGNISIANITNDDVEVAFTTLSSIGGDFKVYSYDTYGIKSIDLSALELVGGDVNLGFDKDYDNDLQLAALDFNATIVGGDFVLTNTALVDVLDFESLEYIGSDLEIDSNTGLFISNSNFSKLQTVEGDFIIQENSSFDNIGTGLNNLKSASSSDNDLFPVLSVVDGDFVFSNNYDLTAVEGFNELTTVDGSISILGGEYTSFVGFNKLQNVEGDLYVSLYNQAASIGGFSALETVEGKLTLQAFEVLGFEALLSINEGFTLWATRSTSFNSLTTVEGEEMYISADVFPTFDGLTEMSSELAVSLVFKGSAANVLPNVNVRNNAVSISVEPDDSSNKVSISGFGSATDAYSIDLDLRYAGEVELDIFNQLQIVGDKYPNDNTNYFFTVKYPEGNEPKLDCFTAFFENRIALNDAVNEANENYDQDKADYDEAMADYTAKQEEHLADWNIANPDMDVTSPNDYGNENYGLWYNAWMDYVYNPDNGLEDYQNEPVMPRLEVDTYLYAFDFQYQDMTTWTWVDHCDDTIDGMRASFQYFTAENINVD